MSPDIKEKLEQLFSSLLNILDNSNKSSGDFSDDVLLLGEKILVDLSSSLDFEETKNENN